MRENTFFIALRKGPCCFSELESLSSFTERKEDAVEIFKREHPDGLICSGIRRGDFKLIPFKELSSSDPWEEIAS